MSRLSLTGLLVPENGHPKLSCHLGCWQLILKHHLPITQERLSLDPFHLARHIAEIKLLFVYP